MQLKLRCFWHLPPTRTMRMRLLLQTQDYTKTASLHQFGDSSSQHQWQFASHPAPSICKFSLENTAALSCQEAVITRLEQGNDRLISLAWRLPSLQNSSPTNSALVG